MPPTKASALPSVVLAPEAELPAGFPSHEEDCGSVRIVGETHDGLELDVDAARPCLLFIADTHSPGWSAAIDGEPTPLLVANHVFQAVAVTTAGTGTSA